AAQIGGHHHRHGRRAVFGSGVDVAAIEKHRHLRENAGGGDAVGEGVFAEAASEGQVAVKAVTAASKLVVVELDDAAGGRVFAAPGGVDVAVAAIDGVAGELDGAGAEENSIAHAIAIENARPIAVPGGVG